MNRILILLIGILIISCNQNKKEKTKGDSNISEQIENSQNFDWLLGNWKRLDEEEGNIAVTWSDLLSDTIYLGGISHSTPQGISGLTIVTIGN